MTKVAIVLGKQRAIPPAVQVAALWQMIPAESAGNRLALVKYLHDRMSDEEATRALAKMAIFSEEDPIRSAAVDALKTRSRQDYAEILVKGLSYPWPAVAERASDAGDEELRLLAEIERLSTRERVGSSEGTFSATAEIAARAIPVFEDPMAIAAIRQREPATRPATISAAVTAPAPKAPTMKPAHVSGLP